MFGRHLFSIWSARATLPCSLNRPLRTDHECSSFAPPPPQISVQFSGSAPLGPLCSTDTQSARHRSSQQSHTGWDNSSGTVGCVYLDLDVSPCQYSSELPSAKAESARWRKIKIKTLPNLVSNLSHHPCMQGLSQCVSTNEHSPTLFAAHATDRLGA